MKRIIFSVLTVLNNIILYPFTALCVFIVIFLSVFKDKKIIIPVLSFWAKGVFFIIGKKLIINGKELIDKNKKYLILANHSSLFDITAIMAIYPNIAWFGRASLLEFPLFGRVLKIIDYVPMKSTDLKNTKLMINALIENTSNKTVGIFPEGTRTLDGKGNKYRKGFIHVLRASKLDVLPVSLTGFYNFKPKNRFSYNYNTKLEAKVHKPITYRELYKLDDKTIINKFKTTIEKDIKNKY